MHNDGPKESVPDEAPSSGARRGFIAAMGALVAGGLAGLAPIAAGARSLLDPLRTRRGASSMVRVTSLDVLPDGAAPRRFTVRADRTDAWTTYANRPVGAVYLRRVGDEVTALNVVCPHAGCFVGVAEDGSRFECPCHRSSFSLDGEIDDPASPSPRAMDSLDVEVRDGNEVWVRFQNFQPGRAEKDPIA